MASIPRGAAYAQAFFDKGVSGDCLAGLSSDELRNDFGVRKYSHRKALMRQLSGLARRPSLTSSAVAPFAAVSASASASLPPAPVSTSELSQAALQLNSSRSLTAEDAATSTGGEQLSATTPKGGADESPLKTLHVDISLSVNAKASPVSSPLPIEIQNPEGSPLKPDRMDSRTPTGTALEKESSNSEVCDMQLLLLMWCV